MSGRNSTYPSCADFPNHFYQYDSGATLASYVNSTIEQWASEAQAFVAWRDTVWLYALAELDRVQKAERDQPSIEEFIAELPKFEWPEPTF